MTDTNWMEEILMVTLGVLGVLEVYMIDHGLNDQSSVK